MDDIIESKDDLAMFRKISQDIQKAIDKGGFQVKEWIFSGDISKQEETIMVQKPHTSTEKILGLKEITRHEYPEAADIIQNNTYMDDIIESKDNLAMARKLNQDIEKAIVKGGFQVKEWIFSGNISKQEETINNCFLSLSSVASA